MAYDPERHHRRSIRLKGYDYAQPGAYFITVCTQDRVCLFGDVVAGEMRLNEAGRMVSVEWDTLPTRFPTVQLDEFVIMPNHIHGIIGLCDAPVGAGLVPAPNCPGPDRAPTRGAPTLGGVVGAFKSLTTVSYTRGVTQSGWSPFPGRLWQRNYYEHIIRDEESLNHIRQYILDNPARWALDRENPAAVQPEPEDPWRI